jgi:hypothetical protein
MSPSTETLIVIGLGLVVAIPVLLGLREVARGFAEARAEWRQRQGPAAERKPEPERDNP